jgi:16S rRNA (cytosine1402-N4)-methyltransferase
MKTTMAPTEEPMQGVEVEAADDRDAREERVHAPVLAREVVASLGGDAPESLAGWIVDATVGAGGHAAALLEACPRVQLLGVDQDPEILAHAEKHLAGFGERAHLTRGRLSTLDSVVRELAIEPVVGVLFDLGVSSLQLDRPERGFSFQADGPLDMRMDPDRERTAADIVNHWDEADLADLFYYEGGESRARRLAHAIVGARRRAPFLRTGALAELIEREAGSHGRLHAATRVFQALRRAVNEESEELAEGLAAAETLLAAGGRLAVISFHSGEDGAVKRFFQRGVRTGRWRALNKKPITASREEVRANRRARSASLRAAERARSGAPESRIDVPRRSHE